MSLQIGPTKTAFNVSSRNSVLLYLEENFQLKLVSETTKKSLYVGYDRDTGERSSFEMDLKVLTLANKKHQIEVIEAGNWDFLLPAELKTQQFIDSVVSKISRRTLNLNYNLSKDLNDHLGLSDFQNDFRDFLVGVDTGSFFKSFAARRLPFDQVTFNFVSKESLSERGFDVPADQKNLYTFFAQVMAPSLECDVLAGRVRAFFKKLGLVEAT